MAYSPSKPPSVSDADAQALAAYLTDELQVLASALRSVDSIVYSVSNAAPVRPRVGTVVYADGTHWNPGSGEGLYVYSAAGSWIWLEDNPSVPSLPLSIANGGTADIGSAWTSYTPTVTKSSGTITATGRYKLLGKTCFVKIVLTYGTAVTGSVTATLPFAAVANTVICGVEGQLSGTGAVGYLIASGSVLAINSSAAANFTANGSVIVLEGVYETT